MSHVERSLRLYLREVTWSHCFLIRPMYKCLTSPGTQKAAWDEKLQASCSNHEQVITSAMNTGLLQLDLFFGTFKIRGKA